MEFPERVFSFWVFLSLSSFLAGMSVYAFAMWWRVGGMRGLAYTVVALSSAIVTGSMALLYSGRIIISERLVLLRVGGTQVPAEWIIAIQEAAWFPLVVFLFLLIDMYVSLHNSHRSITTIAYFWYIRLRGDRRPPVVRDW